jgi:hypothetical protein
MVMAETPRCLANDFRFTPFRRGALDLAGVARRTRQIRLGDYNVKDTKSFLLPLTLKSSHFSTGFGAGCPDGGDGRDELLLVRGTVEDTELKVEPNQKHKDGRAGARP